MKSVVLLSGGIDSVTALAVAAEHNQVHALTVLYGQTHHRELLCAETAATKYGAHHVVVPVEGVIAGSALTGDAPLPTSAAAAPDATYVPARNTVLLSIATAYAESVGAEEIVIGANADDAAGYPDCRPEYFAAMQTVLCLGTLSPPRISTPLIDRTKGEVIWLAHAMNVDLADTWSCYVGGDLPCGECGACIVRGAGFAAIGLADPAVS